MLRRDISREWPLMLCIEPLFESFTENMAYIDLQENRCEFTSHDLLQMSTKQCAFFDQTSSLFKFMKWVWITSVRSQLDQNEVAGPPAGANARYAASGPLWSLARVVIGEPDRLLRIPCLQLHGILFRVSGYDMPNHANVYPQYWYQNLVSEWRPAISTALLTSQGWALCLAFAEADRSRCGRDAGWRLLEFLEHASNRLSNMMTTW